MEEVTNYTKAGGACGKCKAVIQDVIDTYYNKEKAEEQKLTPTQWILKVNNIIETQISPELQKDGGDIELIDIKNKSIYVKLRGKMFRLQKFYYDIEKIFVEKPYKILLVQISLL